LVSLVARVELIEEQVEAGEPPRHVAGGEVHAVVVVPERAERLARIIAGHRINVVMIPVLAASGEGRSKGCAAEKIARKSVALGRTM
jgi:hypothetical protein